MSDEYTKADGPATAAPKKPRAKKANGADGSAKAATAKRTASSGTTPPAPAEAKSTALAVTSNTTATDTSTPDKTAFGAVAAKVTAMMPDDMPEKAREVAGDVKDKASDAVQGLARIISDSAGAIDDNVGPKYGDYARTAAQSVSDAADRLRAKPVDEIAEDTREFVRTKPGTAIGIAAVAGLMLARIFGSVFGKKR